MSDEVKIIKAISLSFQNAKQIHIFDIDNCICPNVFPNLNETVDIAKIKRKINQVRLYKQFLTYFKRLNLLCKYLNFFIITGRKFRDFGKITFLQLRALNISKSNLIFYPQDYSYSPKRYSTFKIYNIIKIIWKNKVNSRIYIYDDNVYYYPKLQSILEMCQICEVYLIEINSCRKWADLTDSLKL